jgi:hypothetical protein
VEHVLQRGAYENFTEECKTFGNKFSFKKMTVFQDITPMTAN